METKPGFREKLSAASGANNSLLCVGLDPDPGKLPRDGRGRRLDVLEFNRAIIDATADLVCAYKPNFAFYGALGESGWSTLASTLEHVPNHIPAIVDAKVGDIGNTAERYARMMFDELGAGALTVNPYMGRDAVAPFLSYADRGVFLLCLTSNPGSEDLETLNVDGRPLYERVAEKAADWDEHGNVGLVVGATKSESLQNLRALAPELPFLIPGVGAQGGDVESAVLYGDTPDSGGIIINASRSVIYASDGSDFQDAARRAAESLRDEIEAARHQPAPAG